MKGKTVPEMLGEAAEIYEERKAAYGDNYKQFGLVMKALFPKGLSASSLDDFNRLGVLIQIVSKLTRYVENFGRGGHDDSLADLSVYATMLRELDCEARSRKYSRELDGKDMEKILDAVFARVGGKE